VLHSVQIISPTHHRKRQSMEPHAVSPAVMRPVQQGCLLSRLEQ